MPDSSEIAHMIDWTRVEGRCETTQKLGDVCVGSSPYKSMTYLGSNRNWSWHIGTITRSEILVFNKAQIARFRRTAKSDAVGACDRLSSGTQCP